MRRVCLALAAILLTLPARSAPRLRPSSIRTSNGCSSTSSPGISPTRRSASPRRTTSSRDLPTTWPSPGSSWSARRRPASPTSAGSTRRMDDRPWSCRRAEAWLLEGAGDDAPQTKLGSYAEVATSIADFSRPADVTAELVDVGVGDRAADYAGIDVKGKIVLASGNPSAVMEQAVWKRGAAGILSWASTRLNALADAPDQIAWLRVPQKDGPSGEKTTFAFVISARAGKALSDRLRGQSARAGSSRDGRRRVAAACARGSSSTPRSARSRGRRWSRRACPGAIRRCPRSSSRATCRKRSSRPTTTSRASRTCSRSAARWRVSSATAAFRRRGAGSASGGATRFTPSTATSPTIRAKRRRCSRTSTRTWSARGSRSATGSSTSRARPGRAPSYLSDVQESVFEMVVAGNNAFLPAWQAGSIAARRGVLEADLFAPRHARALCARGRCRTSIRPTISSSTTPGSASPGTTLTNWPDENIHSSSDDLWQMDPTQLKRNAFVVAATAWWLATAGPPEASAAASWVASRGAARIADDLSAGARAARAASPPASGGLPAGGRTPDDGVREGTRGRRFRAGRSTPGAARRTNTRSAPA